MENRIIYITGSDGVGKTTFLMELEKKLLVGGNKTRHIWIRSPKIFSKPLMAYCRLIGLTKYKTIEGVKYSKHEFYKSSFVSWLFPILQILDFKIKWYFEKRKIKPNEILLFDRFNIDTLADLMVDTRRMDLHKTWVGNEFLNLTSPNSKIIVLDVDAQKIRQRKKDTLYDEHLIVKIEVYNLLSKDLKIKLVDNNKEFITVKKEVENYFINE